MKAVWYAAWGLIALLFVLPIAGAVVSTVTIDAGVEYQSRAGGGIITFTDAYAPTSVEISSDFLILGAPTTGYTSLGIDAPIGADISVTGIESYELTYSTTQALGAKTERVYAPGRIEPTVTGAGSSTYAGYITSIITNMSDNVKLTWQQATSYEVTQTAVFLSGFLPLLLVLAVVGIIKEPDHWKVIVGFALVIGVMALLGQLYLSMGF
jgi:hypothetical protein